MCKVVPLSSIFIQFICRLELNLGRGMYSVIALGCVTYNIVITSPNGNGVISHLPNLPNFAALCFYTSNSDHVIRCYNIIYVLYYVCMWFIMYIILKQGFCPLNFCRNLITLISPLLQIRHSCFCIAPQTGATFHIPRSAYVKVIFLKVVGDLL